MQKTALLFGCGSKWGLSFTKKLAADGYKISLISSSDVVLDNVISKKIDWITSNKEKVLMLVKKEKYDLIFFNQNSGGGPGKEDFTPSRDFSLEHWNLHLWINCQLPYVVIKHLSENISEDTKIGWMLTGLIIGNDPNLYQYAGYAGLKSTNLHIMRGFSEYHPGIFFAINPLWFPTKDYDIDAEQIKKVIEKIKKTDSGKSFNKDGTYWI